MEYDLDQGFPPLSTADIFPQIKEIYSMNTYRGRSEEWAHKEMQFLVYDDTDDVKPPKKEPPTPEIDGYDSNDEESQLEYAIKLSLEDGDAEHEGTNAEQCVASATIPASKRTAAEAFAEKHPEMEEVDARRQGLSSLIKIMSKVMKHMEYEGSTSDHHWEECELCSPLPEFPHDRKPRKLRLFRPRDMFLQLGIPNTPVCSHYIPMSYCWPPRQKDKNGNPLPSSGSYQIREPDGTIRTNRASDEVLDRAIDIAQTCGLRMIWVDQECLPQQDSEDREIGLQAMDIVYHRAIITAGLHSTIITSPHHIRFIGQLVGAFQELEKEKLSWETFDKLGLQNMIPTTLDFIDKVRQEKWYKRAWIAQEALSASGHILLVFPLAPGLKLDGPEQQYRFNPSLRSPTSSLDKKSRVIPTTQWSIPDSDFQSLINGIAEFYSTRNRAGLSPAFLALKQHAVPILEAAADLWPSEKRNKRSIPVFIKGGASYGYRRRMNAAGALTVFRTRSCTRPHDRLAIMANMCGYEIRINTQAAAARGGSLRTALLALAMLNNDMSLFVPELYRPLHGGPEPFSTSPTCEAMHGAELFRPFDTSADRIQYYAVDDGLRVRPKSTVHLMTHDVRRPGLSIPAYVWEVEGKMDLSILKDHWKGHWMAIKASQHDFVDHKPGENASVSPISPKFIESNQEARRQLVEIIVGILWHTHLLSGDDDRAQGVADSIWQSIRSGFINLPLPDHVGQDWFDHPHVQDYDWDILQLDHSIDEKSYSQLWFIEKIMTDGALWVGRYARFAEPRHNKELRQILQSEEGSRAIYSKHVCEALLSSEFRNTLRTADVQRLLQSEEAREALESEKTRELLRLEDVRNALELEAICKLLYWDEAEFDEIGGLIQELVEEKDHQPIQGGSHSNTQHNGATPSNMRPFDDTEQTASRRSKDTTAARSKADMMSKSIMDRQMSYEMMATMIQSESLSVISRNLASVRNDFPWWVATMIGFAWNPEVEANRIRKCVSVFDVSGPCVVATPFEADLEVLPRSRIRSLSRCWVVKHVADEKIPEGDNVASGKKPAVGIESVDIGVDAALANKATRLYRVVGKVRGLWEIMEFPSKAHYFT